MLHAPIMAANAIPAPVAPLFVELACDIVPGFRHSGYSSDDLGLHATFAPAVYVCRTTGAYLAGYLVVPPFEHPSVIRDKRVMDVSSFYADEYEAAIAADSFADRKAEEMRAHRPAPTPDDIAIVRHRCRPSFDESVYTQDEIRACCGGVTLASA